MSSSMAIDAEGFVVDRLQTAVINDNHRYFLDNGGSLDKRTTF